MPNGKTRKKDSARLVWDSKPRRAPNPRDIEFQTAEVVIPNPQRDAGALPLLPRSFDRLIVEPDELPLLRLGELLLHEPVVSMNAVNT